ncbi:chemotaxis protein CheW [Desulforudis sp. 1088]|uniref:chemotaxis protein CheW n=1 Tax=unclassified Candidatus Desulforudis TaxID=2635950 RepID=UPI003CE48098
MDFSAEEMGVFLDEMDEKIQVLTEGFMTLEREGARSDVLQEVFRAAHTIKGSSAMMGFEDVASLTHELESLLDALRGGKLEVSPWLVNVLFEALDALRGLREKILGRDTDGVDTGSIVQKLRGCQASGGQAPFPQAVAPIAQDTVLENGLKPVEDRHRDIARGDSLYEIRVTFEPSCPMPAVRAFIIIEALGAHGVIEDSVPSPGEIKDGVCGTTLKLTYCSQEDGEELRNLIASMADVAEVTVKSLDREALAGEAVKTSAKADAAVKEVGNGNNKERPAAGAGSSEQGMVKTVRIDVSKLDNMMNLVGELVIERTRLDRLLGLLGTEDSETFIDELREISGHFGQVAGDLQDQIMKARMLPIAQIFNRFPRLVRDLSNKLGKKIELVVEGRETELDRNVIELINDPLIHLIRNAVDHGIESPEERLALGKPEAGTIKLRAHHRENHIFIIVQDDGRGLKAEALKARALSMGLISREEADRMEDEDAYELIFLPGFSTADTVSDLSGRGVGMDIVRTHVERINGTLDVESEPGAGTKFTIKLPLTLAIIRSLLVNLGSQTYAFPMGHVTEIIQVRPEDINRVGEAEFVMLRGSVLPLIRLDRFFGLKAAGEMQYVVVVGSGRERAGVLVDTLLGDQEIVIKSLGDYLGQIRGLSGATILGDGRVALILDVRAMIKQSKEEKGRIKAVNAAH